MHINDWLKVAVDRGASDLHVKVGSYPMLRVRGALLPAATDRKLEQDDVIGMSESVMSAEQRENFKEAQEIDLAYAVPGLDRKSVV